MLIVIGVCIGFVFGILTTLRVLRGDAMGNLIIVDDQDEGSHMFLQITKTDIEKLRAQLIIKLNVVDKGKTPHK